MLYRALLTGLRIGVVTKEPHLMEIVSLVDETVDVYAAQLIRSQRLDPNMLDEQLPSATLDQLRAHSPGHPFFPRDYLYIGLTSELPQDPALAPHDCICVADVPLPEAYTTGPLDMNLILFHIADRPDALLDMLNAVMFGLSDDSRYYRGIERISVAEHQNVSLIDALMLTEELVSNPILLVDERGFVLGIGKQQFPSEQLRAEIQSGLLKSETLQQLRQNCFYPLRPKQQNTFGWNFYSFVCIPIRIRGLRVAELYIQIVQTAFHNSKFRLSVPIANLIASIIAQRMEAHNDHALLHNLLFSALLQVEISQKAELQARIAELRWQETPGMQLLCFPRGKNEDAFERMRQRHPGCRWTTAERYHLMLLYPEKELPDLSAEMEQEGLRGGLSWPFDNLMQLQYAYIQAKAALAMGSEPLTEYASVFVNHIFTLSAEEAVNHLHPAVLKLDGYDRTHEGNLMDTLMVYLSGSEQTADVAARLFISRSTLFYRINRIRELCGVELLLGEERMNILLSLRLLRMFRQEEE